MIFIFLNILFPNNIPFRIFAAHPNAAMSKWRKNQFHEDKMALLKFGFILANNQKYSGVTFI
jgi:hypothetical protein